MSRGKEIRNSGVRAINYDYFIVAGPLRLSQAVVGDACAEVDRSQTRGGGGTCCTMLRSLDFIL